MHIELSGMRFRWGIVLLALGLLFFAPPKAWGQGTVTFATVSGDVVDKNGSSVPKSKVTIHSAASGFTQTVEANEEGHFAFLRLQPGTYQLSVEHPSFKKAEIKEMVLLIGEQRNVRLEMQIGDLHEKVEVNAEEATIGTTQPEIGTTFAPQQVQELPLNQRSFTALVTQQPALVQMTNTAHASVLSSATNSGSYISADGLMGTSVAYLMDGVNFSNGSFTAPGTAAAGDMPGVEGIEDFKILTHNFSAAYGGSSAAVVSFATRTGTNKFHGSVYEYLRNDIFDARAFFDLEKPPYRRNQFGAALGGPIAKDKTFFFLNYEGLRQRLTVTDQAFVPTQCARNSGVGGSGVGCAGGVPVVVTGCTVFGAGNVCTAHGPVAISPGVQGILSLYPLPNSTILPGGMIGIHSFQNRQPTNQDFGLLNITHQLTSVDALSARYSITDANSQSAFHTPNFNFARKDRSQNILLKWSRAINQRMVNTLSFSFVRSNVEAFTNPTTPLTANQLTGNPSRNTVGVITVGAGSAGTTGGTLSLLGNDDASPLHVAKNVFPLMNDFSWLLGHHTLKIGGGITWYQWNWSSATITGGSYTFNSLNDLLAANPGVSLIHRDGPESSYMLRTKVFNWYVEDSWRVNQRLTLTLGIRHDFQAPILKDKLNRLGNWRKPTDTAVTVGKPYDNYSLTQFQPRIGLAYDIFGNGKTILRSGFGIFNDFIDYAGNGQGQLQWNAPQPVLNTSFGDPIAPGFLPAIQFPTCTTCTAPSPFVGLVTGVLDPMNSPTSIQWSMEVERQLPWALKVSVTYAGSNSFHIPRKLESNYNLPCGTDATTGLPTFPASPGACGGTAAPGVAAIGFSLYSKLYDAVANYHGLTLKASRSFQNGFSFQLGYAFAKAISESDSVNSGNVVTGVAQSSMYPGMRHLDRSESLFSIRHRFTENFIYELPFGKGRKYMSDTNAWQEAFFGGWQFTTLGTFQSGYPFSVLAGVGISGVGDNIDYPDRPNQLNTDTVNGSFDNYLNLKSYSLQAQGRLGNAARNSARGPGFAQLDFGIGKVFTITENIGLKFRADFFNFLNHPNFGLPFNQIYAGAPQFTSPPTQAQVDALPCNLTIAQAQAFSCNPQAGRISSTVGVPREIQFSLKLSF